MLANFWETTDVDLEQPVSAAAGAVEADKLLIAITEHAPTLEAKVLTDFQASDLVKTLSNPPFSADLPYMGGGKAIANRLRELKGSLTMTGWSLTERKESGRTLFTLQGVKG